MSNFNQEEKVVAVADIKLARQLWPYLRPRAWMLGLGTAIVFMVTFLELLLPTLTQKAIDGFIVPQAGHTGTTLLGVDIFSFPFFCMIFGGCIVVLFLLNFTQTLFLEYTGQKIILELRCILFYHMSFLPVAFYDQNSSGRLVSRVTSDIENMSEMFTSILIFIFKDLFMMAAIFVVLFFIHARLALYLVCLVPLILILIRIFSGKLRRSFREIRQKISEINHNFSEAITGIRIIQTTASQNTFIQRFKQLNNSLYSAAIYQIRIFSILMPMVGFFTMVSTAVILGAGSFHMRDGSLSLGQLVAFLTYMKLFFQPLRELAEKFNLLQSALASAERVITILGTPKAPDSSSDNTTTPLNHIDTLAFKNINFSYDGKTPILSGIHFELEKGQSMGIVGPTGSGKSSIINLISGFYTAGSGDILINGQPSRHIPVRDIRNRMALVMQDPFLFSGTLRDNISPPGFAGSDDHLTRALENANCQFVFEKFDGLDFPIEEGGKPLSSGEKQLICIARAFAFDPDLIIFDEATSYMDSQSEQVVHDAMNRLMNGRISLIIAHRLSTVRACDTIILLRSGKIREKGSHDELVKLHGEYYHLLEKETI